MRSKQKQRDNRRRMKKGANMTKVNEVRAVEIRAEIRKIQTMADGSINVLLNLPEDCLEQVKVLMDWQKLEVKAVIAQDSQ